MKSSINWLNAFLNAYPTFASWGGAQSMCLYQKKSNTSFFSQQKLKTFVINCRSKVDMKKKENNVREGPLLY